MARKKLEKVPALDKGKTRLASIKSIDANLDLGNGVTAAAYESEIDLLKTKVSDYNTLLSGVDNSYNQYEAQLAIVKTWNERILNGVAFKYGTDSNEYEMAGGKRKSERKKPTPKNK